MGTQQSWLCLEEVHWIARSCPPKDHGMTPSLGMRSDVAVAPPWPSGCHRPRGLGSTPGASTALCSDIQIRDLYLGDACEWLQRNVVRQKQWKLVLPVTFELSVSGGQRQWDRPLCGLVQQ